MILKILALSGGLAACGEPPKSEGFVSDNNLGSKPDFSESYDAYPETLDAVALTGTLKNSPAYAQRYDVGANDVPLWGFALRMAAPKGAAGDVEFFVYDGDGPTFGPDLGDEITSFTVAGEDIGTAEGWVEAQLGAVDVLPAYATIWIAAYPDYAPASEERAVWSTVRGQGFYKYDSPTQSWLYEGGRAGIVEIPCQRGES
jgi:hypothetical protein